MIRKQLGGDFEMLTREFEIAHAFVGFAEACVRFGNAVDSTGSASRSGRCVRPIVSV